MVLVVRKFFLRPQKEEAITNHNRKNHPNPPIVYEIRIKGHLDSQWTDWFSGLTVTLEENGDTLLTGPVIDQAALHGLLKKIRDLGMPLISISLRESGPSTTLGAGQADISHVK
jgi:hypothetical protein